MDGTMTAPGTSVKEKGKVVDLTKSLRPRTTDIVMERNSSEEEEFGEASSFLSQSAFAVEVKFPSDMAEGMSASDITRVSPTPLTTKLVPAGKAPGKVPVVIAPPVADPASTVKMPALKVVVDENAEQARILELSLDIAESVEKGLTLTPLLMTGSATSVAQNKKTTTEKRTTGDDLRLTPPRAQKKREAKMELTVYTNSDSSCASEAGRVGKKRLAEDKLVRPTRSKTMAKDVDSGRCTMQGSTPRDKLSCRGNLDSTGWWTRPEEHTRGGESQVPSTSRTLRAMDERGVVRTCGHTPDPRRVQSV